MIAIRAIDLWRACLLAASLVVGGGCSSRSVAPPPAAPLVEVTDLVKVLSITCDLSAPEHSFIQVRYLTTDVGVTFALLRTGDVLSPQHADIVLASIEPSTATFTFADGSRAPEVVSCARVDSQVALEQPRYTMKLGEDRYWLGVDDLKRIREEQEHVLESDGEIRQHRNPKSGKYDGIEFRSVRPGSIAARHGFRDGDVVRSINGHAVSSICDAITFVKANSDSVTTWDVVVEHMRGLRTLTFDSGARK